MKKTVPVIIHLDKEVYDKYKAEGKDKGFVPRKKLADQANSFMKKQNVKGG